MTIRLSFLLTLVMGLVACRHTTISTTSTVQPDTQQDTQQDIQQDTQQDTQPKKLQKNTEPQQLPEHKAQQDTAQQEMGENALGNLVGSGGLGLMGGVAVKSALSKDEIQKVVRLHLPNVRQCYEKELQVSPTLETRLSISWLIGADGKVQEASVNKRQNVETDTTPAQDTPQGTSLEQCLLREIMTWQFPAPVGGSTVRVSYPFIFRVADE